MSGLENTDRFTPVDELKRWYFVCECCDAKFFSIQQEANCPRCLQVCRSAERVIPPWLRGRDSVGDQSGVSTGKPPESNNGRYDSGSTGTLGRVQPVEEI